MTLRALRRQLLRDLKASRAKTAVLAVLLLVGLIVWVPPLLGGGDGDGPSQGSAGAGPSAAASAASAWSAETGAVVSAQAAAAGMARPRESRRDWRELARLLEADVRVRSMPPAEVVINPFRQRWDDVPPPVLFAAEPAVSADDDARRAARTTPAEAGLVLTGTVVGAPRAVATINGRAYRVGEEVRAGSNRFRLTAVDVDRVVLEADGEVYDLALRRASQSERRFELTRSGHDD